jgi:ABC-type nitrate/sulfonate/bicarbonate transport system substrate-binding protein
VSQAVKLGFVPLLDAAPLIVAQAQGFFAREGVTVELSRELSWATVRDKVAVGALDGAHMLAPMALAATLGSEGPATPVVAPFVLNRGGAAVTLSSRIRGEDAAAALRRVVAMRREQGSTPLTFAVVFPRSIHNFLLRRWLTESGLDPDRDVHITVAPPPRMADLLAEGVIEGFCAGQPWSEVAKAMGVGEVVARVDDFWPSAPDKVLALRAAWGAEQPDRLAALLRALYAATAWIGDPANRDDLVASLSGPDFVDADPALIAKGLSYVRCSGPRVNAPDESDAAWLVHQMSQAGQLNLIEAAAAAQRTFRRDLFDRALQA